MGFLMVNECGGIERVTTKHVDLYGSPTEFMRLNDDVALCIFNKPLNDDVVRYVYDNVAGAIRLTKVFGISWSEDVYSEEDIECVLIRTVICRENLVDEGTALCILKQEYPYKGLTYLGLSLRTHGFSDCLRGFILAKSNYHEGVRKIVHSSELGKFNSDEEAALAARQLGFPIWEDKEHGEFLVTTKIERDPAALLRYYTNRYKEITVNSHSIALDGAVVDKDRLSLFEFCLQQFADLSFVQTTKCDYVANVEIGENDFVLRVNYGEELTFYFTKL